MRSETEQPRKWVGPKARERRSPRDTCRQRKVIVGMPFLRGSFCTPACTKCNIVYEILNEEGRSSDRKTWVCVWNIANACLRSGRGTGGKPPVSEGAGTRVLYGTIYGARDAALNVFNSLSTGVNVCVLSNGVLLERQ